MKNETKNQPSEEMKKVAQLIQGIQTAMLTNQDETGKLRSRPMATQQMEFDGDLWFFTGEHSHKVSELLKSKQVQVSYADPEKNRYVSVSGVAIVIRDSQKAKELWSPVYKAWFPQGLDDPDLALLKVKVESVEYWDTPSNKMVQLFGFVKATLTGKGYQEEGTDHKKLDIAG